MSSCHFLILHIPTAAAVSSHVFLRIVFDQTSNSILLHSVSGNCLILVYKHVDLKEMTWIFLRNI